MESTNRARLVLGGLLGGAAFLALALGVVYATMPSSAAPVRVQDTGDRTAKRIGMANPTSEPKFGADVIGRVVDRTGEQIDTKATVTLSREMAGHLVPVRTVQTFAGSFSITEVPPGDYRVSASAEGMFSHSRGAVVRVDEADAYEVDVVVDGGGRVVAGTVLDQFGGELEGAVVTFATGAYGGRYSSSSDQVFSAVTDDSGTFRLTAPGTRGVFAAFAEGYAKETRAEADVQGDLVFSLWPAAYLSGVVVDDAGQPVAGVSVFATDVSPAPLREANVRWYGRGEVTVVTDSGGHFDLEGLKSGSMSVHAVGERGASEAVTALASVGAGGSPLRLVLQPAAILRGHVRSKSDDHALADFEVSCQNEERVHLARQLTGHDGEFEILGVTSKACHLVASSAALSFGTTQLVTVSSPVVEGLVLPVSVRGPVSGTVVPATMARVEVKQPIDTFTDPADLIALRPVVADSDGRFEFPFTPMGDFRVRATDELGRAAEVELGEPARDVVLSLEDGLTLRGRVSLEGGGQGTELIVVARSPATVSVARTDDDGTFVLRALTGPMVSIGITDVANRPLRLIQDDGEHRSFIDVDLESTSDVDLWAEPRDGLIRGTVRADGGELVAFARIGVTPVLVPLKHRLGLDKGPLPTTCDHEGESAGRGAEMTVAASDGSFSVRGLRRDLLYRVQVQQTDGSGFGCVPFVKPGADLRIEVVADP